MQIAQSPVVQEYGIAVPPHYWGDSVIRNLSGLAQVGLAGAQAYGEFQKNKAMQDAQHSDMFTKLMGMHHTERAAAIAAYQANNIGGKKFSQSLGGLNDLPQTAEDIRSGTDENIARAQQQDINNKLGAGGPAPPSAAAQQEPLPPQPTAEATSSPIQKPPMDPDAMRQQAGSQALVKNAQQPVVERPGMAPNVGGMAQGSLMAGAAPPSDAQVKSAQDSSPIYAHAPAPPPVDPGAVLMATGQGGTPVIDPASQQSQNMFNFYKLTSAIAENTNDPEKASLLMATPDFATLAGMTSSDWNSYVQASLVKAGIDNPLSKKYLTGDNQRTLSTALAAQQYLGMPDAQLTALGLTRAKLEKQAQGLNVIDGAPPLIQQQLYTLAKQVPPPDANMLNAEANLEQVKNTAAYQKSQIGVENYNAATQRIIANAGVPVSAATARHLQIETDALAKEMPWIAKDHDLKEWIARDTAKREWADTNNHTLQAQQMILSQKYQLEGTAVQRKQAQLLGVGNLVAHFDQQSNEAVQEMQKAQMMGHDPLKNPALAAAQLKLSDIQTSRQKTWKRYEDITNALDQQNPGISTDLKAAPTSIISAYRKSTGQFPPLSPGMGSVLRTFTANGGVADPITDMLLNTNMTVSPSGELTPMTNLDAHHLMNMDQGAWAAKWIDTISPGSTNMPTQAEFGANFGKFFANDKANSALYYGHFKELWRKRENLIKATGGIEAPAAPPTSTPRPDVMGPVREQPASPLAAPPVDVPVQPSLEDLPSIRRPGGMRSQE